MILFTADIHIHLRQKNVPMDWAINRYHLFFDQVHEITKDCNLHIMGGDIFDRLPTMEELSLFFKFVEKVNVRTIIYDGNHEATKKGKTFLTYLKDLVSKVNPLVEIYDDIYEEDKFIIVPYTRIKDKGVWETLDNSKVVFSHIRGEIPPHVKPEIDLNLIKDFPLVYLGDLHSHDNCQGNMIYPGSPMTTSFHRSKVKTGYILIDEEDLTQWTWHPFQLPQLIRKTVTKEKEMVPTDYDHTIYELEGDMVELSKIKDSDLLDKKLVRRATDTALILNADLSIEEELEEYLKYILDVPEDKIEKVKGVYNDHTAKISGME